MLNGEQGFRHSEPELVCSEGRSEVLETLGRVVGMVENLRLIEEGIASPIGAGCRGIGLGSCTSPPAIFVFFCSSLFFAIRISNVGHGLATH